jgi:hypothetical protein
MMAVHECAPEKIFGGEPLFLGTYSGMVLSCVAILFFVFPAFMADFFSARAEELPSSNAIKFMAMLGCLYLFLRWFTYDYVYRICFSDKEILFFGYWKNDSVPSEGLRTEFTLRRIFFYSGNKRFIWRVGILSPASKEIKAYLKSAGFIVQDWKPLSAGWRK